MKAVFQTKDPTFGTAKKHLAANLQKTKQFLLARRQAKFRSRLRRGVREPAANPAMEAFTK